MKIKTLRLWAGLAGTPLAWVAQMSLSETVSSHACYPRQAPLTTPLWTHLPLMIILIDLVCFSAGAACSYITWMEWRQTRQEIGDNAEFAIEVGETRGGFLVMLSAISSLIFMISIVFTSFAVFLVSPCQPW